MATEFAPDYRLPGAEITVAESSVRHVSDTALWVAYFRARETQRPDALFRDPYAERLAGERGFHIAKTLTGGNKQEWAWVARTFLFDEFLLRVIREGTGLVVNLAAGLDARPYRMELPSSLRWVEVDFPEVLSYKEGILAGETPRCRLQRVPMDLSDAIARRALFAELTKERTTVSIVSEGFLIYLSADDVASLAADLAASTSFRFWVVDLASPSQLRMMQHSVGKDLNNAGAPFRFAPEEGPRFFSRYEWDPVEVRGLLKTAARLNRSPAELLPLATDQPIGNRDMPWTGVCLLEKRQAQRTGTAGEK